MNDYTVGNVTVEFATIVALAMVGFLTFAIYSGRVADAHAAVETAARDAARQASIARTPAAARAAALASAQSTLRGGGLDCDPAITIDTSGFAQPLGTTGTVTARITCTVAFTDLALPAFLGTKTFEAEASSPTDPYRGRALGFTYPEHDPRAPLTGAQTPQGGRSYG